MGAYTDIMNEALSAQASEVEVEQPAVQEDGDLVPVEEAEQPAEESTEEAVAAEEKPAEVLEEWEIGGEKIQVNLTDKESIKKVFEERHQLKGVQQEVMRLNRIVESKNKEFEEKYKKKIDAWDSVEAAYARGGVDAVMEGLLGVEGANEYREGLRKRFELIAQMSPEEKAMFDRQEMLNKKEKDLQFAEEQKKREAEAREREREQIFQEKFDAMTQPAFFKYAFNGQLGDKAKEDVLNKSIWSTSMERVQELIDKGQDLTPQQIDGIFKSVAELFQGVLKDSGTKEAKKVVEETKKGAQTRVAAQVTKGMSGSKNVDEIVAKSSSTKDMFKSLLGLQ